MGGIEEKRTELVKKLLHTDHEDDWWSLMEHHYEDRAALLHAIICLVNHRANRDAYTYFSVPADVPIENSQN